MEMTQDLYDSLTAKIYSTLMAHPDMGMGEMGACADEADRIVDEWMQENNLSIPE
jgi:hypothetical protein